MGAGNANITFYLLNSCYLMKTTVAGAPLSGNRALAVMPLVSCYMHTYHGLLPSSGFIREKCKVHPTIHWQKIVAPVIPALKHGLTVMAL